MTTPTLWHYTCEDGHTALGQTGNVVALARLLPHVQLPWTSHLAWFTDLDEPDPDGLGLTKTTLRCDRTTHRYMVTDITDIVWWPELARYIPGAGELVYPGARPDHWWCSNYPVPVVYDPQPSKVPPHV